MRTVQSSRGLSLLSLFILSLSLPFTSAFDSSWSHRHMFRRSAHGLDKPLAAAHNPQAPSTNLSPTASPPLLPIPPIVPSIPLQPLPLPTTTTTTTTTPSLDTTSTPSTPSTPTTTSTTSSSASSSTSSPTTLPTTSSAVQSTSSTPAPIVEQASSTAVPTTLIAAPSPVDTSPDAFTSVLPTPSPTPTQSSPSFLSNTGAVAGTFTVVGLFGVAGIIGVGMLIVRRRRSRREDEDMEYLDETPDLSADPPMKETGGFHMEDNSMTEDGHYGAPPMSLSSPPMAYYPDYAYPTQPRGYPVEAYAPQAYIHGYPGYATQRIYRPEDYNIAYPPQAAYPDTNMPNPHSFADVELGSTPVPSTQATTDPVPDALRPTVQSTSVPPQQRVDSRFSIDSFYTGMATEKPPSTGRAL